ncbi:MAG: hypothetical protein AAGB48_10005, partial [Planctomycetota bacterium]
MLKTTTTAAALLVLCGQAMGQVTVDGQIDSSEASLYTRNWVNDNPTNFGDNLPQTGVPEDNSDAANVTTGLEYCIPLEQFGLSDAVPTGQIRIAGWVTSGDGGFMSNQVIGGLGGPGANLGDMNPPSPLVTQPAMRICPVGTASLRPNCSSGMQ